MNNEKIMLELADGGIINIDTDKNYTSGCPTCDYGSEYINYIEIMTTKFKAKFRISQMYDYVYDDLLKIILPNINTIKGMLEIEFINWFLNKSLEKTDDVDYKLYDKDGKIIDSNEI